MKDYIKDILEESITAHKEFALDNVDILKEIADAVVACFKRGNKVIIMGNGGSASDALHIAGEFVGRFEMERPTLPAIALTGNTAAITAIGNDYSYDEVFEKQVAALVNTGDIVWGISTSGNSENVIRALKRGIRDEAVTIGFAGRDGGKMAGLCDHLLIVKHQRTARIQELHILAAHIICGLVDEKMFGKYSG